MKSLLKNALGAVCALSMVVLSSATSRADKFADILSKGVVRIIVYADVPPFSSSNVNRELEGFDVDLAKMVAEALGVKLELVPATAANRIPYLLTDRADMNIAAMSVTAERAKQVMYSAPYADTSLAVYGPKATVVKSAADVTR
jgi:polar amino acid transport system substrate-binding protein